MNEIFDKLAIRIIFTLCVCLIILFYKYAHYILYPSSKKQLLKQFHPSTNSADTIHLFARLLGIGIIFSECHFNLADGIMIAILLFTIQATISFLVYLVSIYIMESIILCNFEYRDEILKRKNLSYAIVCFSISIGQAYIIKTIISVSNNSIIFFIFLSMLSIVILGFATKTFSIFSKIPFNSSLTQKNISVSFSYLGFMFGLSLVISSSLSHEISNLKWYIIQIFLKIILSIIIFPIFKKGLMIIFKLQEDFIPMEQTISNENNTHSEIGHGIYEGAIFLTSFLLTSIITGKITFGTFYPTL